MSEQNKAIVEQAYTNFMTGNIEALLNLFSDDISWTLPEMEGVPFGGERNGRAAIAEFFNTLATAQEFITFEPRELIAEDNRVIALGSYRWRVKANGHEFGSEFAHAWTVKNGKATGFQEFMDTAACVGAYEKAMTA